MKSSNYLFLEYQRTLKKFQKLQTRFEKRLSNGTIGELTARKRYFLIKKIRRLRDKLEQLISRLKLAGMATALSVTGLLLSSSDINGQDISKTIGIERQLLNTTTAGDQMDPSVAINNEGDVVSVWLDGNSVKGRAIDKEGMASDEFDVFVQGATSSAEEIDVSMDSEGNFAVAWIQNDDGDRSVQMKNFDAGNFTGGSAILVDDLNDPLEYDFGLQNLSIELEEDGDAMLTYGEQFDDANHAVLLTAVNNDVPSAPVVVNSDIATDIAGNPVISLNNNDDGIIVWQEQTAGLYRIYYRTFEEGGASLSTDNVAISELVDVLHPDVSINDDGDFVVGWSRESSYLFGNMYAKSFDKDGNEISGNVGNINYSSERREAKVGIDHRGNFILAHEDGGSGSQSSRGARARLYTKTGSQIRSVETFEDADTGSTTSAPGLAVNDNGEFAVVWSDDHDAILTSGEDTDGQASYIAKYENFLPATLTLNEGKVSQNFSTNSRSEVYPQVASEENGNYVVAWRYNYNDVAQGYNHFQIKARRFDVNGKPLSDDFLVFDASSFEIGQMAIDSNDDGEFVVAWLDDQDNIVKLTVNEENVASDTVLVRDNAVGGNDNRVYDLSVGLSSDGDFSVVAWSNTNYAFDAVYVNPTEGSDGVIAVNNYTDDSGDVSRASVAVGMEDNFIVAWADEADHENAGVNTFNYSVYYRRFDGSTAVGDEVKVADGEAESEDFENVQVTSNQANGDFAIVYEQKYDDVLLIIYEEDGSVIKDAFSVMSPENRPYTYGMRPQVDMNSDGNISVMWQGYNSDYSSGYFVRKFDDMGNPHGTEAFISDSYEPEDIAIIDGGTVGVYSQSSLVRQNILLDPQPFDVNGLSEELVNLETSFDQRHSAVASNSNGDYVIVWEDKYNRYINARIYDADGAVSDEIHLENHSFDTVHDLAVALNDDGNFMVLWSAYDNIYNVTKIYGEVQNLDGTVHENGIHVSIERTGAFQGSYDVTTDQNDDFAVVWAEGSGDWENVYYKKFDGLDGSSTNDSFLFDTENFNLDLTYDNGNNQIHDLDVAVNDDGDIALAYYVQDYAKYGMEGFSVYSFVQYTRSYDSELNENDSDPVILSEIEGPASGCDCDHQRVLDIVAEDAGTFAIIYTDDAAGHDQLLMAKYSPDQGQLVGDEACVAYGYEPSITNALNGEFVIGYRKRTGGSYFKRLDGSYADKYSEFELSQVVNGNGKLNVDVAHVSDEKFVGTWYTSGADGFGLGVERREFDIFYSAPKVDAGLEDQSVELFQSLTYTIPENAFDDSEDQELDYDVVSQLPSWLLFDSSDNTFDGEPGINEEGDYMVTVRATDSDGLWVEETFNVTAEWVLSSSGQINNQISLYPNPVREELKLSWNGERNGTYGVYLIDASGQMIFKDQFNRDAGISDYRLSTTALNSGIYILKFTGASGTETMKFIKE